MNMSTYHLSEAERLQQMATNKGFSVAELAEKKPVILFFLRHFGCMFCKEALMDISKRQAKIDKSGAEVVYVHMSAPDVADTHFKKYELLEPTHVSDPDCVFYQSFGLEKGNISQLFGLRNWIRGFSVQVKHGGVLMEKSDELGDPWQMPGIFLVHKNQILERFVHSVASEKPNYDAIIDKCQMLSDTEMLAE